MINLKVEIFIQCKDLDFLIKLSQIISKLLIHLHLFWGRDYFCTEGTKAIYNFFGLSYGHCQRAKKNYLKFNIPLDFSRWILFTEDFLDSLDHIFDFLQT